MKRISSLALILFLYSTTCAFQGGGGESTKRGKRKATRIIEGTISDFECGDNCYLTITDNRGKERIGLCLASLCNSWTALQVMPARYKGKRVKVTIGKGTQFDGGDNVIGRMDAFTNIQFTEPDNIDFLRKLGGSLSRDDLLSNPVIRRRLQNLLGRERWAFMYGHWNLGAPHELTNDVLVATGCMSHFCPDTNFIIAIDITKNRIYVGVRDRNRVKFYSEDNNQSPEIRQRMQRWITNE